MGRIGKLLLAVMMLVVAACAVGNVQAQSSGRELIVCGWDEVFALELAEEGPPRKTWIWRAAGRTDLPAAFQSFFTSTDECKPVDDGQKILITSSADGVALVDRVHHRVLFYGRAPNAHSADLLPGNRIAVAASHRAQEDGDRLILFDVAQSDRELWSEELPRGHGVVWDKERGVLWALADEDLRLFLPLDWDTDHPKLDRVLTIPLPEGGGHDLYPISGSSLLTVTTSNHCWLFDRDTYVFRLHPELSEQADVKSISVHPITNQVVYVQAEGEHWWAERLHFLSPRDTFHAPGEHFYKARWNARTE